MADDMNQEILAELRKVRSSNNRVFYTLLILIAAGLLSTAIHRTSRSSPEGPSWESVNAAIGRQDFPKALGDAYTLVQREPRYYYGHTYLGGIYLAMGDLTNAQAQFEAAHRLFPGEQTEKDLTAIRKLLAAQPAPPLLSK